MSENYSRRNHTSNEESKSSPKVTEHVSKGFTAFQKVLTAVGTILSIIVASITIMNFTSSNKDKDTSASSSAATADTTTGNATTGGATTGGAASN